VLDTGGSDPYRLRGGVGSSRRRPREATNIVKILALLGTLGSVIIGDLLFLQLA
jgi:hypothetical protein